MNLSVSKIATLGLVSISSAALGFLARLLLIGSIFGKSSNPADNHKIKIDLKKPNILSSLLLTASCSRLYVVLTKSSRMRYLALPMLVSYSSGFLGANLIINHYSNYQSEIDAPTPHTEAPESTPVPPHQPSPGSTQNL